MTTICKYCNEPENKQERPGLVCEACICFVHLNCLRQQSTPGNLACDVFFDFVCEDCSDDKREVFKRNRFPWANVIYLALYHLNMHSYGISNHGYFHYKTHICHFIDRNWTILFGTQLKQKKNWVGTIAGALSVYSNMLFRSGSLILGEMGWWKLMHSFTPAVAAHIIQEMGRVKPKNRQRNQTTMDGNLFFEKVTELGYKDLIVNDDESAAQTADPVACKKRRVDSDELSAISSTSYLEYFDSDSRNEATEDLHDDPLLALSSHNSSYSEMEIFRGFDFSQTNPLPPSDSSSTHSFQQSNLNYDSDSHSYSPYLPVEMQSDESEEKLYVPKPQTETKPRLVEKEKPVIPLMKESLFSSQLNSLQMPWADDYNGEVKKGLVKLSEYEEVQLLKRVEDLIHRVKDPNKKAELRRFRTKLSVRRLKRHKRLPVFEFDKTLRMLGGYNTEDPRSLNNIERVLDRFQTSYLIDNLSGTVAPSSQGPLLVSRAELTPFRSPYSGAILKPYIRRDTETVPLWLKLMDELLQKTNRHVENYSPPPHASIDYSYVRPQHIAAVNGFCAQHFWPGIDRRQFAEPVHEHTERYQFKANNVILWNEGYRFCAHQLAPLLITESLQYPEFSCVVTYKRLVIGCAFLVPDVKYNEAYISFILTRPGWQGYKIATFMLYHLLQTCTGKDVTLHVSPTNPAIFLYQKFGFKVEELIQDFYEKYFDVEYKGCRHALFLRLVR